MVLKHLLANMLLTVATWVEHVVGSLNCVGHPAIHLLLHGSLLGLLHLLKLKLLVGGSRLCTLGPQAWVDAIMDTWFELVGIGRIKCVGIAFSSLVRLLPVGPLVLHLVSFFIVHLLFLTFHVFICLLFFWVIVLCLVSIFLFVVFVGVGIMEINHLVSVLHSFVLYIGRHCVLLVFVHVS